jgi:hypothetical protein
MSPDLQRWWRQSHWLDLHWIEVDLTIWIEQIPEQGKRQTTSHKDDKQNSVALRRQNHKRKTQFDVKITYLNRREGEKRFRGVIWGQKLTLNHPSLVDEGDESHIHDNYYSSNYILVLHIYLTCVVPFFFFKVMIC